MALPGGRISNWGLARRQRVRSALAEPIQRRVRRRPNVIHRAYAGPRVQAPMLFHFADQPLRKFAKLKYVCHQNSTSIGANSVVVYEYRANGMYDPEVAVGGHQPYGFDQLMAQYEQFTVYKAKITAEMVQVTTNSDQVWQLMVYSTTGVAAAAFAAGSINGLRELPIISRTLMPTTGQYQGGARSATVYCDCAKMFGRKPSDLYGLEKYSGSDAADPTDQLYFALVGHQPNLAESTTDVAFMVTITYHACFTQPKYFTTS